MPSFLSKAALLATASLTCFAMPADVTGTVQAELPLVDTGRKLVKNGPLALMKAYKKYSKAGAVAPAAVVAAAAAAASQTGSATASPEQYDSEYLVPVTAGSTTLMLDFDTGSSDLWVFYTGTPSSETSGQTLYNPSGGSQESGETWSISYGDGSGASGIVYADKVAVGAVTATSQSVEAATSVSSTFSSDSDSDGLLGLAFGGINTCTPKLCTTFFDTVKSSLANALFTADLKYETPGTYTFGYIDSSKYTGTITYTAVDTSNGFWEFTAGGYAVGSGATSGSIGSAIADTGTTLLYLPDAVVDAYYDQVSDAFDSTLEGGYIFPCSSTLPDFIVSIGGATYTVPGEYINYAPIGSSFFGDSICFGGIQSSSGIGFNIFGDIFLKSVYVVFDQTTSSPRLGFAEK